MNTQDFERLKAICEKEGFGIQHFHTEETYHIWKKNDIWEGVEFAESLLVPGSIIKMPIHKSSLYLFKPSTEQAYIEQLKKEAFKRFGEIKVGDKFYGEFDDTTFKIDEGVGFEYRLRDDTLMFNGWAIYENGVWAEKKPNMIEVDLSEAFTARNYQGKTEFKIYFKTSSVVCPEDLVNSGFKIFLKKSIEHFINNEI